jgi:ParB-like chromosome segregation protein Spo0J
MQSGVLKVPIEQVHPNSFNPNSMSPIMFEKLKLGLKRTLKEAKKLPPIIVRQLKEDNYEIIDGYHRWKALQQLGKQNIRVFVLDVDDVTARLLCNQLNYVHGEPEPEKYKEGILSLVELGTSRQEIKDLFPDTPEDLDRIFQDANLPLENFSMSSDEDTKIDSSNDLWVDLKFKVTLEQATVIEQELQRIGVVLRGKNMRGRCLEYMAVMSSHSELPIDL